MTTKSLVNNARAVAGWPGYFIDPTGRIWSTKTYGGRTLDHFREMKLTEDADGYLRVNLSDGPRYKQLTVHSLVLQTFIGPRPRGMVCCHKDGDRKNNDLKNLRWGTVAENCRDTANAGSLAGEKHPTAKMNWKSVRELRAERILTGKSFKKLGRQFGIGASQAFEICAGKGWKKR